QDGKVRRRLALRGRSGRRGGGSRCRGRRSRGGGGGRGGVGGGGGGRGPGKKKKNRNRKKKGVDRRNPTKRIFSPPPPIPFGSPEGNAHWPATRPEPRIRRIWRAG